MHCKVAGPVKIAITGEVSISAATVIIKREIKATAVLFLFGTFLELLFVSSAFWLSTLLNNNMWRCGQHCQGRYDGEQGECYQAKSVKNHRGELPITFNRCGLFVITDLVSNHFNFFENKTKFPGDPWGVGGGRRGDVLFTGWQTTRDPRNSPWEGRCEGGVTDYYCIWRP